jgi:anti-sigma B factor antagonist/stage II sporulation protein AA (anti-sigma F factor antagonist)
MSFGLTVSIEEQGRRKLVRLEGRVDANTTPTLEKKLSKILSESKQRVLIDFSRVDYLSSAGMRLLLSATKKISAQGGKLVFCGMSEDVMEIIRMAGFDKILAIYPTELEALKAL